MIAQMSWGGRFLLSVNVTENVKEVDGVPEPGLAPPFVRDVVWIGLLLPPVQLAAATGATNGALKPSTIATTSEGATNRMSGRRPRRSVFTRPRP
jgi:hypothetical protein